jgi:hypothetical protein
MVHKTTTPPKKPEEVKAKTDWPKAFKDWAAGQTGFTEKELIDVFATSYNLTPTERKTLERQIKPEPQKQPTPKPTTPPTPAPPKQPTVKPDLIIARTPYPKWWKDSLNATINLTAPGSAILATVAGKLRLYVATILITVTGETVITITFGNTGASGPIYLGGTDQPMGIVIAMGNSPAPCGTGPLSMSATDPGGVTPSIGGFATCFAEEG